jgi:hypothetical protein
MYFSSVLANAMLGVRHVAGAGLSLRFRMARCCADALAEPGGSCDCNFAFHERDFSDDAKNDWRKIMAEFTLMEQQMLIKDLSD